MTYQSSKSRVLSLGYVGQIEFGMSVKSDVYTKASVYMELKFPQRKNL